MGMKFTKVRSDTFQSLQINAGIVASAFAPADGTIATTDILGATTGGIQFASNPEYMDFGEDVDNVPNNTYQLKRITSFNPVISGTFVAVDAALAQKLVGTNTYTTASGLIVPSNTIDLADFGDIWFIGDYSDKNGSTNGGFIAIHVLKAYSTGGFQWQSTKDGKGQFAFEFTGHYDLDDIDKVPYEMYVKAGAAEPGA